MLPPGSDGGAGGPPGMMPQNLFAQAPLATPKSRTLLEKLLPLVHLIAGWALLAYFVIWKEPQAYDDQPHTDATDSRWRRWAELGWKSPTDSWGVQFVVGWDMIPLGFLLNF